MLDRIEFLIGEATVAMRRNVLMQLAAITTVAASLFLLGGLLYVYFRATEYANALTGRFEMRVFLKDGTTFPQIRETAASLRALPGVREVNWIPRDKAWQRELQERPDIARGLENPFPDAFRVVLRDIGAADQVVEQIQKFPTVMPDGVQYLRAEQELMQSVLGILRWIGLGLGGLLFITAGVLIYNAIRLTIVSRRLELRVMQLVGASRATISIPFMIEGLLQGLLGGSLAATLILACNHVVAWRFPDLTVPAFPIWTWLGLLAGVGAGYGVLCSLLAIRKPLKYR